ncbi:MAG: tRNA (guanosine(37)-N1)-methyltransferase TrmD [candidate division Zixibacteria bacterium]|nr:tRNA (guanosine(37)-N1)-methyltransferase TrmD [candidate division Zixibacteria bacterium]
MKFEIITLFPDYFTLSLKQSLLGKAQEKKLFEIEIIQLRDFATDKHHTVDDTPFGGGGGMVMKIDPLDECLKSLGYEHKNAGGSVKEDKAHLVLTSAAGRPFTQDMAIRYSLSDRMTIICGHYLGIDERINDLYDVEEVSIGDYVLTGGEPAAAVMVDAVGRLIPKVLGNFESALDDSYMNQMLGSPCYTKPAEYEGIAVPQELLSGNHVEIKKYRRRAAIRKCLKYRPDLLQQAEMNNDERRFMESLQKLDKVN